MENICDYSKAATELGLNNTKNKDDYHTCR